ncbi:hypothetical protein IIA95_03050 [Patescibacteria group bacterium]|nr:hypothetical protein [Patescibacteria group bacterium]
MPSKEISKKNNGHRNDTPTSPGWIFGNLGGGMASGPNAGPTVEFRGNPSYYIAREALQNIMDAKVPNSDEPVKAEFEVKTVKAGFLPDAKYLEKVFRACAKYLDEKGSHDTANDYKKAAKKLKDNEPIKFLRISDRNTSGMTDENWFRFAESVGFSNKESGSGGSFGLGKGAYYVSSAFLTLFISSVYNESGYRFAGKSIISTFELDGERKQNNGTYGVGDQQAILEKEMVPKNIKSAFPEVFDRTEQGTDFLIPDFIGDDTWSEELVKAILRYFWLPIHQNKLVVNVNKKTILDSSNLEKLLMRYFANEDTSWSDSDTPNPLPLYDAYQNGDKIRKDLNILGPVDFYLLVKEGYPKRIAYIRKPGMMVSAKRKSTMNSFSAVLICENPKGNELLRGMENQEHNEWKWQNAKTIEKQEKAKKAYEELTKFVNSQIQKINESNEQGYMRLEGLEDFITMESEEGHGEGETEEELKKETGDIRTAEYYKELFTTSKTKDLRIVPQPVSGTEDEGGEAVYGGEGRGDGPTPPNPDPGERRKGIVDEEGELKVSPIKNLKFESFASEDSNGNTQHFIYLKGDSNKVITKLEVLIGTDDQSDKIDISKAEYSDTKDPLNVKGGVIKDIGLNSKGERKIQLIFEAPGKYSLKCKGYENR